MPNPFAHLSPRARLICGLVLGPLAVWWLLSIGDTSSADPQPACATTQAAADADGETVGVQAANDCLNQVDSWCQRNHPNETLGECADIVYGYIPGPFRDQ